MEVLIHTVVLISTSDTSFLFEIENKIHGLLNLNLTVIKQILYLDFKVKF